MDVSVQRVKAQRGQNVVGAAGGRGRVRQLQVETRPVAILDQEGKVVSTDARGPRLEADIKRLLGL